MMIDAGTGDSCCLITVHYGELLPMALRNGYVIVGLEIYERIMAYHELS